MQLNCKVKKKSGNSPHFYINPPPTFQGYSPFLAKFLVPPKWLNFWKVLPLPLIGKGFQLWADGIAQLDTNKELFLKNVKTAPCFFILDKFIHLLHFL